MLYSLVLLSYIVYYLLVSLYLLTSAPIFLLAVLFSNPYIEQRRVLIFSQLVRVLVSVLLSYLILRLLAVWLQPNHSATNFILYELVMRILLPLVLAILCNIYLFPKRRTSNSIYVPLIFFSLFNAFFAIFDPLSFVHTMNYYSLFVMPSFRIFYVLMAAILIYGLQRKKYAYSTICAFVLLVFVALQLEIAWLSLSHYFWLLLLATVCILALSMLLFAVLLFFPQKSMFRKIILQDYV